MFAATAASAEEDPAEERDVFKGRDGPLALGAAGARADDGLVEGQAGDANVEEAAEDESDEEDKDGR